MGTRGDGAASGPHGPIYLPFTLPNEEILVETDVKPPKLVSFERSSADRVAPICRHFGNCGGCKLQHWRREPYLAWKRGLVAQALRAQGVEAPVGAIIDAHGMGRRRATLHARREGEAVRVGFMRTGSHAIVAIEACPVLAPSLAPAPRVAADVADILTKSVKPLDIAVTLTETGLDVAAKGHGTLAPDERERLVALAERYDLARLANHHEVIVERRQALMTIGRCLVALSPGAFLQATAEGEAALAALVAEGVGEAARIADLFCGIGPFSLRLA